ncbi:methyl farnesoate epoxidase-like isoform X1 [Hylaeus anthracinus]|uniref:methyl farnesoate epoxidase-like isoform X1 n=2 Tax=Hylaeus anthracinus TaxID=313031 RepID=UPI0023BA0BB1|nr:methyl farnesoate epoxidase-like isoform X1 [Hylaeus anthracinus]
MFVTGTLMIVVVVLLLINLAIKLRSEEHPPGPFPWLYIGNYFLLKRLARELGGQHLAFSELSRRYGSEVITLNLGISKMIVVSGSKSVQTVLESEEFDGRPWNEFIKIRNFGKKQGVTMNDGPHWKFLRKWTIWTLKSLGFGKYGMSEMIKEELTIALESLKKGGVYRLKPVISPVVINVLWRLSTGARFSENARLDYFVDLMERRARVFDMAGGILSSFPWIRYVAPEASGYKLLVTLNTKLKEFLMEIIVEHKEKYVAGSEADLIDMFIHEMVNEKGEDPIFTDDQLVMIMIDLFLAGVTTTETTLELLFLNMVVHQDVQRKLQQEIDSVIPPDRLPDLSDMPKLPYARAVMTETQRRWTVIPVIGPRRVLQKTRLENYRIPKDSTVLINLNSVHMDPDIFPDPEKFQPERFLKDGEFDNAPNTLFFGKGKRRCPGDVLAKTALFLLFIGVMQKYSLLPVPGKGPTSIEVTSGILISPKPYDILVVPRINN